MSFLEYTGKFKKNKNNSYIFSWSEGPKTTTKDFTAIMNPTLDNSFKSMFGSDATILKSLLNSILFPKKKLITKLEFYRTNFEGKNQKNYRHGSGSKNIDVGCKCYLKKNNLKIKDNILIIDVEMQIGFSNRVEERFIDYANIIRVHSNYNDTWVVAFILRNNLKNNIIQLNKIKAENLVNVKEFQSLKIIEINLNHCFSLIEENKDIILYGEDQLDTEGEEWIKLLSSPIWCQSKKENSDIFIMPDHTQNDFVSKNVKKAIDNIVYVGQNLDLSYVKELHDRKDKQYFAQLEEENKNIKKENDEIKEENKIIKEENDEIQNKYNKLKEKYESLLKEQKKEANNKENDDSDIEMKDIDE